MCSDIGTPHGNSLNLLTPPVESHENNKNMTILSIHVKYCIKFYSTDILIF